MQNLAEDNEEIVEQVNLILKENDENLKCINEVHSSKGFDKEKRVAKNISNELSLNNISGDAEQTKNNKFSDVKVNLKDNRFFIEVKLDDKNSPFLKIPCYVNDNKLKFEMKSVESAFNDGEYGNETEETFQDVFIKTLENNTNIWHIDDEVGRNLTKNTDYLKSIISDNIESLKEKTKQNFKDIHQKNIDLNIKIKERTKYLGDMGLENDQIDKDVDIKKWKNERKRYNSFISGTRYTSDIKKFEENLDTLEKKINKSTFPKILGKLNDFFDVMDDQKKVSYYIYREKLREYIDHDTLKRIQKYSNKLKTIVFDIIYGDRELDQDVGTIFDSKNRIEDMELSEDELNLIINPREQQEFLQIYNKMMDIAALYVDILEKCNEYRKKKRNKGSSLNRHAEVVELGSLEYWEKVRYLYESFFSVDKNVASENGVQIYDPQDYKVHGFSLCSGSLKKNEQEDDIGFNKMLDAVEKYYRTIHNVKYIQCGDDIYYFSEGDDPLKIAKSKTNNIIKFDEAFKEFQYNLFLITYKGSDYSLKLFVVFVKTDKDSSTSFDNEDEDGRDSPKPFPTMGISGNGVVKECFDNMTVENELEEGLETSKTKSNKFELEVTEDIRDFLHSQKYPYNTLEVEHYEESDLKYWSDIKVTNQKNGKRFWVEAKEDKYACLGSSSFKYSEGKWTCSTLEDNDPLLQDLMKALEENSQEFIRFCKDYLGTEDIVLPRDLTDDLVEEWKNSGLIEDTENDVFFITSKVPLENFGEKIASYYKLSKNEPAYYIQIGDDLYLIDESTNILKLKTKDGQPLKTLAQAYRIGRIQFRLKRYNRPQKTYYSIYEDIKILADKENLDENYSCSFLSREKWPVIDDVDEEVKTDKTEEMQAGTEDNEEEIKEHFEQICKEDAVGDVISDLKKIKSTNSENPDTKVIRNISGSKILTLIVALDGRLILTNTEGETVRRDDGGEMYFDDKSDAVEWAEERGYEVDSSIEDEGLQENLTIPQNKEDKIESDLYKNLEKNYDHADRIIRWYRNEKKSGTEEKDLKSTFIDNLDNIKDLLKTYDSYIEKMKTMKMLGKKVEVNGMKFDVVKDIDKIRRLSGFQSFVKEMGNIIHSGTTIDTTNQKYAITDEDRSKIRIIGFTENVVCWCTEDYETTNKFIYQLWQNSKTLGRGDVYGDPSEQTPYCTHSKEHWDDYSEDYDNYQQFWFLLKLNSLDNKSIKDTWEYINRKTWGEVDNAEDEMKSLREKFKNVQYQNGNLTNENVARIFNLMKGTGPRTILAMNDTGNDFLDRYDEHFDGWDELNYGDEIKKLNEEVLDRDANVKIKIGGKDVILKKDRTVKVKGEREQGYTTGDIKIDGNVGDQGFITSLEGCPEHVKGDFEITRLWRLQSLKGCPKEIGGLFKVYDASIETLEGCPKVYEPNGVGRHEISIGRTKIKNLNGIDPDFDGHLEIFKNELTSFEGFPQKCTWFAVDEMNIDSLKGLPGEFSGTLDLTLPKLKSLDYAPKTCKYFSLTDNRNISFDERGEYKKYREVHEYLEALSRNYKMSNKDNLHQRTTEIIQKINYWYNIHTMPDGKHYRQSGPTQYAAISMDMDKLKEMYEKSKSDNVDEELENAVMDILNEDNIENIKLLTNVPEDNIKNILDTQNIENRRYERSQFTKYFGIKETNWVCLMNENECLAMAALANDNPFKGYTFVQEIQTLRKGYGRYLLEEIFKKYGKVSLMANTMAGEDLLNYYRKLNLEEILVPDSVYGCPAYFFCTKDCDYEKLEAYYIAFYSNDEGEGEIDEAEQDIGGEKSDLANVIQGDKIWIDDIREAPEGFKWFKTVREFIKYIDEHGTENIELIDTDHDAGDYQKFGGDYIRCFDYLDFIGAKNIIIHIHSANPVGANNIRRIISKNKEENGWREVRNTAPKKEDGN